MFKKTKRKNSSLHADIGVGYAIVLDGEGGLSTQLQHQRLVPAKKRKIKPG
jgi:hypothetical protein